MYINLKMDNTIMNASMNLLRRLPAKDVPKNLIAISELIQDEEIRDDVQVKTDKPLGKLYTQSSPRGHNQPCS